MTNQRILVVDDEPDVESLVLQNFRRQIKADALQFSFAKDGAQALSLIETSEDFDVILTDINMPVMDGLTLLRRIQDLKRSPATVVVSAYGDMKNIRAAMNAGAFDFVTKPIEFEDLRATLDKTLNHTAVMKDMEAEKAAAQRAEAMLSRYFSPSVVSAMAHDPTCLDPKGARREGTFLFTDLQDFLRLVESSTPDVIVDLLNAYLDGVTRIIFEHDGTVMKIIGDSVHAAFGAPAIDPDHARKSIQCALAIDAFSEAFRAQKLAEGIDLGVTRIGINTGPAVIGTFGGEKFFDFAAYGGSVNMAARLEQANKALGTRICVSASTAQDATDMPLRPVGDMIVKGMDAPVSCFEPIAPDALSQSHLMQYTAAFDALKRSDGSSKAALAALIGAYPDDALAAFHLARVLGGKDGIEFSI